MGGTAFFMDGSLQTLGALGSRARGSERSCLAMLGGVNEVRSGRGLLDLLPHSGMMWRFFKPVIADIRSIP